MSTKREVGGARSNGGGPRVVDLIWRRPVRAAVAAGRGMRTRTRTLALTGSALVLSMGFAVVGPAQPASAAVCTHRTGVSHSDVGSYGYNHTWTQDSVCGNDYGAPIYELANAGTRIATMSSTSSWFVCYVRGALHAGGNNIWYYTQGDRVVSHPEYHAWGYMPAVNVHTVNDPGDSRLGPCP